MTPTLDVTVTDPDDDPMNVTFFGRPVTGATPTDFTIGVLPDTQFYSETPAWTFQYNAQTQWLVDSRAQYNTQFVTHMGDIVENADVPKPSGSGPTRPRTSWTTMRTCPTAWFPGNHDISNDGRFGLLRPVLPTDSLLERDPGTAVTSAIRPTRSPTPRTD